MKKKIAIICCLALVVVSVLTIFAACNKNNLSDDSLKALRANLYNQYREDKEVQQASYKVLGEITGVDADGKEIKSDILWTIDGTDKVTISAKGSDGLYTVVVPDPYTLDADISYTLTATLVNSKGEAYKNSDGDTYSVSFARKVQAESGVKADAVMTLDSTGKATLAEDGSNITWVDGGITLVNHKASSSSALTVYAKPARFYKSTTVEISYGTAFKAILITLNSSADSKHATGFDGMEVEGATIQRVGDSLLIVLDTPSTSFVSGALGNQTRADKVELFLNEVPELQEDIRYETEAEILEALKKLKPGETLTGGKYSLTGTIVSIDDVYSSDYNNVTVTIEVGAEKLAIQCFRLEGGQELVVGDEITVTGVLLNYDNGTDEGKLEFNAGCTYVKAGVDPNQAPEHVTDKTIDALVANPPANMKEIYEVVGIWVPTGADNDQYGNGDLYDPSSGNKLTIYGMALTESAFSYADGVYKFTNPKEFQDVKTHFNAGDQIKIGIAYNSSYKNYYAYFIQKEDVANSFDYTATVSCTPAEGGTANLGQNANLKYGDEVTVTVSANAGYEIDTVTHNGAILTAVSSGTYKFKVLPGPNAVVVKFADANAVITKFEITPENLLGWTGSQIGYNNDPITKSVTISGSKTVSMTYCTYMVGSQGLQTKIGAYLFNTTAFDWEIESIEFIRNGNATSKGGVSIYFSETAMSEKPETAAGEYKYAEGETKTITCNVSGAKYFRIDHTTSGAMYLDMIIIHFKPAA